jgi:hypothetical protein
MKNSRNTLAGRGDYGPITPMKPKDLLPNYLANQALPNPAVIYVPSSSSSNKNWAAGGSGGGGSIDIPPPNDVTNPKKSDGSIWSAIISMVGNLANAGSRIFETKESMNAQQRRYAQAKNYADQQRLFALMNEATHPAQSKSAGFFDDIFPLLVFLPVAVAVGEFIAEFTDEKEEIPEQKKIIKLKK